MKLLKVKLIKVNINPTLVPYIGRGDVYIDKKSGQYFVSETDLNNKKVLGTYQPLRFSLLSTVPMLEDGNEASQQLLSHEEIVKSSFISEMLDELLDGDGSISSKFSTSSFDVSLCEFIIEYNNGECWLEEKDEKKFVIHLQDTKFVPKKKLLTIE